MAPMDKSNPEVLDLVQMENKVISKMNLERALGVN
jgi:hypothetical protein